MSCSVPYSCPVGTGTAQPDAFAATPFAVNSAPAPPEDLRPLGRSREYARGNLPRRLSFWHAPRANRWELVCVSAGRLRTQWLGASGVAVVDLPAGDSRWIAPGMRWRVADMAVETRFALRIYAADALPVGAPQPLRAALFDDAEHISVDDAEVFRTVIAALVPGGARLLHGCFDYDDALPVLAGVSGSHWFWHPLHASTEGFTAFVTRSARPVGLMEYLGCDHALIEAVLSKALRGDAEYASWLHLALTRHMAIEEKLLFPAYLEVGGRESWVRGLRNEHAHLRRQLAMLANPDSTRRFLLLLDGHDEKEEQIVYPDIVARLTGDATDLTRAAMFYRPGQD
jgi:hypothetical protein